MKPDLTPEPGMPMENEPDMPMEGAEQKMGASSAEQCVPLEALAMPGEGEQMENPAVGDPVSYTVEGKVSRVGGKMAYVTPETVNGKPVEAEKPAAPEPDGDEQGMNELKGMASEQGYLG